MTSSTFFFVFIPLLAIILLAVNLIFAPHNPYQEKDSVFECGFHSFLGQNRTQFSISFFIFALLFLLFDLEILLVYPYVVSAHTNEIYGLVIMLIFFLALTLGFAFELGKNALKIDSRQMVALNKEAVSLTSSLSSYYKLKHMHPIKIMRLLNKKPNNRTFHFPRFKNNGLIPSLGQNELVDLYVVKNKEQINNMYIVSCFEIRTTHRTMGRTIFSIRRKFVKHYLKVVRAEGNNIYLEGGRVVFDASGGAAVSCLGHTNARVAKVMNDIITSGLTYFSSAIFLTDHAEKLSIELLNGTNNKMSMVYLSGSGSEGIEALIKILMHYYFCLDKNTTRTIILTRFESYHGATSGALALSDIGARKEPYFRWLTLMVDSVSSCNPYHQLLEGESDHAFVERKRAELEAKFQELGPENVAGFLVEPVVGAAMGAVPFVPGYLKAMQEVCHKHGALFMVDEVMCGMGRTGFLHAWQAEENFVPDLQVVAKGLAGGFISVSALFLHQKVVDVLETGKTKGFIHAQTFQGSPLQAATALAVQQIVREEGLVLNAAKMGADLMNKLKLALDNHPNVGNIRGRGLFIGIEFVADKKTKRSFDPKLNIAEKLTTLALLPPYNISLYPGSGGVDGIRGDHFIIAPAYNINVKDVDHIVSKVSLLIHDAFKPSTYLQRKYANLKNVYFSLSNKSKNFLYRNKKR